MFGRLQSLKRRQAWKALSSHYKKITELSLRKLFAEDPMRGERFTAEAVGVYLDYSKNRITDETLKLLLQLAEESDLRERIDAMFQRRKDQRLGKASGLARCAARSQRRSHQSGRQERSARRSCRARQDGGLLRPRAQRRMEGPYRQAHSQRDQRRNRRLRSWPGHGVRGAAPLQPARHDISLRL